MKVTNFHTENIFHKKARDKMSITLTNVTDLVAVINAQLGYTPTDSLVIQSTITVNGAAQLGPLTRLTVSHDDRAQALHAMLELLSNAPGYTVQQIFIGLYQEEATIEDVQELELQAIAAGFIVTDLFVITNQTIITEGKIIPLEATIDSAVALEVLAHREKPAVSLQQDVSFPTHTKEVEIQQYEPQIHDEEAVFQAIKNLAADTATENEIEFIAAALTHEQTGRYSLFLIALAMVKHEEANDEAAQCALGFTTKSPDTEFMLDLVEKVNTRIAPYISENQRAGLYELNIWSSWLTCRSERMEQFVQRYDESGLERLSTPLMIRAMLGDYPKYVGYQQQG